MTLSFLLKVIFRFTSGGNHVIAWDRGRIAACAVAIVSLVIHLVMSLDFQAVASHALFMLLPLSVIFWPEYSDRMFRLSEEGRVHSTSKPTPEIMLQLVGWILLVVVCGIPLFIRADS
ncbi:hypothetical protein HOV93_15630 [Planctomycetes bacterium FF15]|uniref:Uncharacterized protein n=1 Tax=Bremerella alba TaxID=980252 RepID=A0A7V8V3V5_9BACT|nr:hypothetical protein [Bremerella alba]